MSASLTANNAGQLFQETEPGAVRMGAPEVESVVAIGPQKLGKLVQPRGELGLPRCLKTQRLPALPCVSPGARAYDSASVSGAASPAAGA